MRVCLERMKPIIDHHHWMMTRSGLSLEETVKSRPETQQVSVEQFVNRLLLQKNAKRSQLRLLYSSSACVALA